MSATEVVIPLATASADLARGGVFVDAPLALNDHCEVIVRSVAGEVRLSARCVYVDPARGAGLEVLGFDATIREQLAKLAAATAAAEAAAATPNAAPAAPGGGLERDLDGAFGALGEGAVPGASASAAPAEAAGEAEPTDEDDDEGGKIAKNVFERLRGLTMAEAIKAANSPDPTERMALERIYGKVVWEALLRNGRLTAPEVSRLARNGTLPRTLLEVIVNNGAWCAIPEVRRALLSNPRLGTDQVIRILRLLPKHELKVASGMSAYTFAVRDQAKKLLKQLG